MRNMFPIILQITFMKTFQFWDHKNVLTVPNKAIRREEGQKYIYVKENGQPVKRKVKAGIRTKYYTEILDGLKESDQVFIGNVDEK